MTRSPEPLPPSAPHQLGLFAAEPSTPYRLESLPQMSAAFLLQWKQRIVNHQRRARCEVPVRQITCASVAAVSVDPEAIDPFALYLYPSLFYRLPGDRGGHPCLYFAIDRAEPSLLLYVGETQHSNQRWKHVHDCKNYIACYIELHRQYELEVAIAIAFYWNVPSDVRARRRLESALIRKWRSPFNKENWQRWGQPFKK
ncbi:hypothetical protein KR51_00019490 [Rubidibacter lacunae KORDI 51-2]|uniref:GIY-YIG domain-containing protein n=1 Tax=Rubidibacter lacunae KORDI 51-2 TaxID=582515 RepID=U5DI84_9CHRO|nr:hypothetical protein KR51_00019490 [Rubidibacter lacunae KORDI 51-2]